MPQPGERNLVAGQEGSEHVGVESVSVAELVRRRVGDSDDPWQLALVQRHETWDQVRMRYLLDSLLAGYPIGTLLVCQVIAPHQVLHVVDGRREARPGEAGGWQLLDGQQRINALFSIFTSLGQYGKFYLHLSAARPAPEGPATRRRARDDALSYIAWIDASEADSPVPDRARRIDLSRWYEWAERDHGRQIGAARAALETGDAKVIEILNEVDPDFADDPSEIDMRVARDRLATLIHLWLDPVVPVEMTTLASPLDVLEVFTRVNRGGVQVAGQDLFFAAVKTLWPAAEATIAGVSAALTPQSSSGPFDPLIDRMAVLRVLARLASRALGSGDLMPLAIDRLAGPRGAEVIEGMREVAADGPARRRMATLMQVLAERSALGFGLYHVDDRLWDHVLGWAAVSPQGDKSRWLEANIAAIDAYLFAASAFRYPAILLDRYGRAAMSEALAAGVAGEPFPVMRMPAIARVGSHELRGGRDQVRGLDDADARLHFADANRELLLSVVQRLPFRPQRNLFDWDHIYPQAKAALMWTPGQDGRWRRHHRYRRFVGSTGNFWALDAGTNRAVQDRLPRSKFAEIRRLTAEGLRPIWATDRWSLSDDQIEAFCLVGDELERGEAIDPAMERFHDVIVERALGIVDAVLRRMPAVAAFAADADIAPEDPRPEMPIAAALGIETAEAQAPRPRIQARHEDERVEIVLTHADQWGCGPGLRRLVARSLELGLQVRAYKYALSITPPKNRSASLVALTPRSEADGRVTTWVAPSTFAQFFPQIDRGRFDSALGGIRGVGLANAELDALGDRFEELLGSTGDTSA